MQRVHADRQLMVEQQLFDVLTQIEVKRTELELVTGHLRAARVLVAAKSVRVAEAETPLAQREFNAARQRVHDLEQRYDQEMVEIDRLTGVQNVLIEKLLG